MVTNKEFGTDIFLVLEWYCLITCVVGTDFCRIASNYRCPNGEE